MNDYAIRQSPEAGRFELAVEGQVCVLEYTLDGTTISMNRVNVPEAVGGRGLAGELTRFALDHARNQGWQVVPRCPYVAKWIERHPDYADVVETAPRSP